MKRLLTFILFFNLTISIFSNNTIKIATIFPATGEAIASYSDQDITSSLKSARYSVDFINRSGGILGKQIELIEIDNQSTSLGSKLAAEKAVKEGAIAVIGANWSSHSLAIAPVLQEAKIPLISPISTNPKVTQVGDYIFRACYIDPFQGKVMASFAYNNLKAKTAVVITNSSREYSLGLSKNFKYSFAKLSGQIIDQLYFFNDSIDFSEQLKTIKKLNPDIVYSPNDGYLSALFIKQARANNFNFQFLGSDSWSRGTYIHSNGSAINSFYTTHWHPDIPSKENQFFIKNYPYEIDGSEIPLVYDCFMILKDAIERANSFDGERIKNALQNTKNFHGVTGNITFNELGDPVKSAVILQVTETEDKFHSIVKP